MISIVLLTKNAGSGLEQTLKAIFSQDIDQGYEVIAVDSGSTDETTEILEKFRVKLYQIRPAEFNFGLTRNYAFSLASGNYIVTISQDVVPCNAQWLKNLVAPFSKNENLVAVKGAIALNEDNNVFYWEKTGHFWFTSESKTWVKKYNLGLSFTNCAIRKDFWIGNQIGYTLHSEDKLFQKKIHDAGKEVIYAEDAACFHGHQYSFQALIKRLVNEGKGWQYVGVKYGFLDIFRDIYRNKWMVRQGVVALMNKEMKTIHEFLFPFLRPICIYIGNNKAIRTTDQAG